MSEKPYYADLGDLEENRRIEIIAHQVLVHKKVVSFIVDDWPGKADRYIKKLKEKVPGLCIHERGPGPVPHTEFVKIGPRADA